jgi:CRISPR-associated protein Cas2
MHGSEARYPARRAAAAQLRQERKGRAPPLYRPPPFPYYWRAMFVAVACEYANDDHRKAGYDLMVQYGFRKVLKDVFESATVSEMALNRLKKDLDRVADSDDSIRLYQFPVEGTLAITILKDKKWRRLIVKA